jgi:oligopeptidase A
MSVVDHSNPLLTRQGLPDYAAIRPEHVAPAIEQTLAAQRNEIARLEMVENPDFNWTLDLEHVQTVVQRVWGPVVHLNSVLSTPALRDAYNQGLQRITEFWIDVGQNERLYRGFEHIKTRSEPPTGTALKLVDNALRDFRLAGVDLDGPRRDRFSEISRDLAAAQAQFEQNLMDATDAFKRHVADEEDLAGLPDIFVERARSAAESESMSGYLLTLDPPTYMAVMAQADSEALRAEFYEAWVTRASDRGPHAGRWDNASVIERILALRHESAQLLGYPSFAELSLATKMAGSPKDVIDFLRGLGRRSKPVAERDLKVLEGHAGRKLEAWDIAYYSEQLKRERFDFSDEDLRPYFPLPRVLAGLFEIIHELLGIRIERVPSVGLWQADAETFELRDARGQFIGTLLTDFYARPNKRGGAWMDGAFSRSRLPNLAQSPVAYLVCNFNPASKSRPSLLTHGDVVTLFHEFGHALHHLVTEIDYPSLAGIHGVPWDAVELPSQFLENYAWLESALPSISAHYETGEPLPAQTLATLKATRQFQAGLAMVRQLEFGLFDFRLHAEYDPARGGRVAELLTAVRDEIAVIEVPAYNRFANTFAHVFGGGYAAGYYSYKWAEVLAADAYSAFEERGSFDRDVAARFRRCILAAGGSRDTLAAFTEFRGREPSLDPLLRQSGIVAGPS